MSAEFKTVVAASSEATPAAPGRPAPDETTQMSLRLPEKWMTKLRRLAAHASTTEDRMVSTQEIVRRILKRELESGE